MKIAGDRWAVVIDGDRYVKWFPRFPRLQNIQKKYLDFAFLNNHSSRKQRMQAKINCSHSMHPDPDFFIIKNETFILLSFLSVVLIFFKKQQVLTFDRDAAVNLAKVWPMCWLDSWVVCSARSNCSVRSANRACASMAFSWETWCRSLTFSSSSFSWLLSCSSSSFVCVT